MAIEIALTDICEAHAEFDGSTSTDCPYPCTWSLAQHLKLELLACRH